MDTKNKNDIVNLRRSQLTRAAYKVVGKMGYYDFTIKDIAKEAGLSTGLVHYYFKNKEDLLLNLLREMNQNMFIYLHRSIKDIEDPVDKLNIFITHAFEVVSNEKDYFYVVIDFWTQVNRNERMKRANVKLFSSYREECAKIIQEGIELGSFEEVDVKYVSALIISIIQGMIIQYVIDNDAFDYSEYTARAMKYIDNLVIKKN